MGEGFSNSRYDFLTKWPPPLQVHVKNKEIIKKTYFSMTTDWNIY
jgi:hypothetical protein